MARISWGPVLERAAEIVLSYGTSVTLRQVFYRLVAEGLIPNVDTSYKRLSALTAEGRRDGSFPDLADGTRSIKAVRSWESIEDARRWLADQYRRDRTEG